MRILLVEDELQTSNLISATLVTHRYAVDSVADGLIGLDMANRWSYDLILLDIMLPNLNGIEVCRRLRAQGCQTPILMLTAKNSDEDIIAGLDAGADDYLAKTSHSSQLLARIRALLRRRGHSPSPVLTWGGLCLDPAAARVTYNGNMIALRPKEYTLLELFLRNPHRIFSRSTIIEHLWSLDDTPVEGAITNLIKDLRQRLKFAGMTVNLIETIYGLGYRLKELPPEDAPVAVPPQTIAPNPQLGLDVELTTQSLMLEHSFDCAKPSAMSAIQQITEHFEASLEKRIEVLEQSSRSLATGRFSLEQRQVAQAEAHKLAGGLGTFGCGKASEIAQAIEDLLEDSLSQEIRLLQQLPRLLEQLKQELASRRTASIS
jgi:DNA-binding response OmpR family regulator/HPt (histidine-containing phosphotransfer) domain-containing protein